MLRKKYELKPHIEHLWSPSYFAVSCEGVILGSPQNADRPNPEGGGAPIAKIKEYIENQARPSTP